MLVQAGKEVGSSVCWEVECVEAAREWLFARGLEPLPSLHSIVGESLRFTDPDGHVLEVLVPQGQVPSAS